MFKTEINEVKDQKSCLNAKLNIFMTGIFTLYSEICDISFWPLSICHSSEEKYFFRREVYFFTLAKRFLVKRHCEIRKREETDHCKTGKNNAKRKK